MTDEEWQAQIDESKKSPEQKAKEIQDKANAAAKEKTSNPYGFSGDQKEAVNALAYGETQGTRYTGGTMEDAGRGRSQVRSRLEEIYSGNSAGANRLSQSQNADAKQLRANQAMQGGGSQMAAGQVQMQQRQATRDLAGFKADEQRRALGDMSKEFRGMGADQMKAAAQYGSIIMGAKRIKDESGGGYADESLWEKNTRDW